MATNTVNTNLDPSIVVTGNTIIDPSLVASSTNINASIDPQLNVNQQPATSNTIVTANNNPTTLTNAVNHVTTTTYINSVVQNYLDTFQGNLGNVYHSRVADFANSVPYSGVTDVPYFSPVAYTGSYLDLRDTPNLSAISGYATTTYVDNKISNVVGAAPAALDTLIELANALGNDANFSTTVTSVLANKANVNAIPSLSGYATTIYVDNKTTWANITGKPSIPTRTSNLLNDTGFITTANLSGYALTSSIPTNTSNLTNDSGFITMGNLSGYALTSTVPTRTSGLTNDSGFITSASLGSYALTSSVPTNTSNLTNDSGFITTTSLGNYRFNGDSIKNNSNNNVTINTNGYNWVFQTDGNLTLPTNTSAINYANGRSLSPSITLDNTTSGDKDVMFYDGNIKYTSHAVVNPLTGDFKTSGNITIQGSLTVNGTFNQVNQSSLNVTNHEIILNDGTTGTPSFNASLVVNRGSSPNVSLRWNENNGVWDQTRDGTTFVRIPINTTELIEGTNLYFTTSRANTAFDNRLASKTTDDVTEGTNLYFTTSRANTAFDSRLASKTTDNLTEGSTNKYYTDSKVRAAISVTGSGSYDNTTGVITVTGGVTSVNTLTGAITLTTTNIAEGTNLYFTTARANTAFDSRLASKTTDNLPEGSNLYYTDNRANTAFDARLLTKTTDNLAEGTNLYFTTARANTAISLFTGNLNGGNANLGNLAVANYVNVSANLTSNNANLGNLVVANYVNVSANLTSNNANLGNLATANYANISNKLTTNDVSINGNITGNLIPSTNVTYDLGSSTRRWKDLYLSGSTINLGGQTLSADTSGISVAGNITGGNLISSGVVSATGNLSGGNKVSSGIVSATGNISGGNLITTGILSVTGNVSGGNLITSGNVSGTNILATGNVNSVGVSAAGNISGGNLVTSGIVNALGDIFTSGNLNATSDLNVNDIFATGDVNGNNLTALGNVTGGNLVTSGSLNASNLSISGNINGGNIISSGVISATGNLSGGNIVTSGVISATGNLSGGNIVTSGLLVTTGNVSASNANLGNLTISNYFRGNGSLLSSVTGANVSGQVSNALITGTVYTNAQPNITSVGTLTSLTVNGNINYGNIIGGNLISANYISGNGSLLTYVSGSNVNGSVANAVYATNAGTAAIASSVAWGNITTKPTTLSGFGITDAYGNSNLISYLTANPPTGTYNDSNVSNYLLGYSGNIVAGNASLGNLATASYFRGNGSLLSGIVGANVTGTVANATYAINAGSASSANAVSWSNISGKPTTISGYSITDAYGNSNVAAYLLANPVTGSYANGNVANYLPTYTGTLTAGNIVVTNNFSANYVSGTLTTNSNAQPNITSLGTLISLSVTGNINSGNATLGNLTTSNYFVGNGNLLTSITGANVTGYVPNANMANTANISNIAYSVSVANVTGIGNIATINKDGNISNILYGNGVFAVAYSNNNVANYLPTFTGNIKSGNANLGNLTTSNYYSGDGSLLTSITGANITGTVANANYSTYSGTVLTNSQPNITSLGTLSSLVVSANANVGNLNTGGNIVAAGNLSITNTLNATGTGTGALIVQGGASVTKDLYVGGNIYVPNLIATNSTTLNVQSPLLYLGSSPAYPYNYEIGFYSNFALTSGSSYPANGYQHTGLVRNHSDSIWYLFSNAYEPAGSTIDLANANLIFDNLKLGSIEARGIANISGNITAANANLGNIVIANYHSGNGSLLTSITGANVTGYVATANVANTANNANYLGGVVATSYLQTTGTGSGLTSITGANVTGQVGNALVSGTVYTSAQPNITSVGTLSSLVVTGNITNGNIAGGNLVSANYLTGTLTTASQPNITSVGTLSSLVVTANITSGNATLGNLVTANYITGTLTTASQPNITSVGTLTSVTVTGNITSGNANLGNLTTSNYFVGNGNLLTSITGANVTGTVANANNTSYLGGVIATNYLQATGTGSSLTSVTGANVSGQVGNALVAGTVYTASQPNITSVGTLSSLTVTGNITSGNANLGNLVIANYVTGALTTSAQPNITSIGTLTTLIVTGNITNGNITGGNLLSANYVAGTLTTASQPNITSVGTLSSLVVTGNITSGNANLGNLIIANYHQGVLTTSAQPNITSVGTLLNTTMGSGNSLSGGNLVSATYLTGTLTTSAQPNITSIGTLSTLVVTGNITSGNATLGNLVTANFFTGNGSLLSSITGANITGWAPNANNANYLGGVVATSYLQTTGTGSGLTSITGANVTGQVSNALVSGTVYTASQPNITSVGTLLNTTMGSSNSLSGGNLLSASYLTGTLTTAAQPNITSVGSLTSLTVAGNLTMQQSQEVFQAKTGATGVVTHDYSLGGTFYHTSIAANFTTNITNLPTTSSRVSVVVLMLAQGATPYYSNALQIGGVAQTIKWVNAVSSPVVTANRVEMQVFTIFNNSGTYTVISSIVSYG